MPERASAPRSSPAAARSPISRSVPRQAERRPPSRLPALNDGPSSPSGGRPGCEANGNARGGAAAAALPLGFLRVRARASVQSRRGAERGAAAVPREERAGEPPEDERRERRLEDDGGGGGEESEEGAEPDPPPPPAGWAAAGLPVSAEDALPGPERGSLRRTWALASGGPRRPPRLGLRSGLRMRRGVAATAAALSAAGTEPFSPAGEWLSGNKNSGGMYPASLLLLPVGRHTFLEPLLS
uniref:Uncharacterized protein n=1 Tax=Sphaerodactylus townsendi TaxID=933632 RepID=A0ACB8FJ94_9SAUR